VYSRNYPFKRSTPAVGFISVAGAKEFMPEMVAEEKAAVSISAEQGVGEVRQKRGLPGQNHFLEGARGRSESRWAEMPESTC
jgi:hypothetical protein